MISPDSKSYPYLAFALKNDLPYSAVLLYADAYKKIRFGPLEKTLNRHEIYAVRNIAAIDRHTGSEFERLIMALVDRLSI